MEQATLEEQVRALRRRLWVERGLFALLLAALAGAWLYPVLFPNVWAVYVDGRPIVAMRDRKAVQAVLEQVEQGEGSPGSGAAPPRRVRVGRASPAQVEIADSRTAAERLAEVLHVREERAVIYINNLAAVALPEKGQAEEVLNRIKALYARRLEKLDTPPAFKESVEVRIEPADQEIWADLDTSLALLRGEGAGESQDHHVSAGETAWTIGSRYHLSVKQLRKLNPTRDLRHLRPGQTLHVNSETDPLVTVVTQGQTSGVQTIPFSTVVRHSPEMYQGKQVQARGGTPGRIRVFYWVRCENGVVVDHRVVKRVTLAAPQNRVMVYGARPRQRNG
jgi:LysM repeat protein